MLSAAGLPLYIHAPKHFVDSYGVSLTALGSVLFGLRFLDVVQDPILGNLANRLRGHRALAVALGASGLAAGMLGLFAVPALLPPLWWFGLTLTLVFTSFSFLTIVFYATGVAKAQELEGQGHIRLARWREGGALTGVCLAAMAPAVLGMPGFALGFAVVVAAAVWTMRGEWGCGVAMPRSGFGDVLRDTMSRRLLILAFVNAAPVAVSSTLFLFYVESVLVAPGWEGPLLILFFLAAALAVPLWGLAAERFGPKQVLLAAMVLSILAFSGALALDAGDAALFALVCLGSGAALGADMTIMPALFAQRLAKVSPGATEGFAMWGFVSKFTLALAAVALLPVLEQQGFEPGAQNTAGGLQALSLLYAGVPVALKLVAIALLLATPLQEEP